MNITFLIGNGFDLSLGLKTRYQDMYKEYVNTASADNEIREFKELLRSDEMKGYNLWSDFEIGMGKASLLFKSPSQYLKCIRDFKTFVAAYLYRQDKAFDDALKRNKELFEKITSETICSFYKNYTVTISDRLFLSLDLDNECNFISFNYTYAFDNIIKCCNAEPKISGYKNLKLNRVLHIHGTRDNEIVMGVDNKDQILNKSFTNDKKILRAFVKPYFNDVYDSGRINNAEKIIKSSRIILIFGMSLGESDGIWIQNLKSWLMEDSRNQLIYYSYPPIKCNKAIIDEGLDAEDDEKIKLQKKLLFSDEDLEKVYDQIHIPINHTAFDYQNQLELSENKATLELV